MERPSRTAERLIARIATASHGVVARAQLLEAGVTPEQIRGRLRSGALLPEHRGVYRVGHRAPSLEARYLAAVLACGERALLAGRAAARLWELVKRGAPPAEVIAPTERHVAGVRTRRVRRIDREDATLWRGVPVTTVARTLVDLAAVLTPSALARAVHEAEVRHRIGPAEVDAALRRHPNAPGAGDLRRVLHGEVPVTLSKLEATFLAVLREAGLPLPQTNRRVGARRIDCRWPEQRLTVELDGYRYHNTRHAWEQDRRREREAHARGDQFRRYTYGDVVEDPRLMLEELRTLVLTDRPG